MNIKQFCNVDSSYARPDGSKLTHDEVYSIVVDAIGLNVCVEYIPDIPTNITKENKKDYCARMYKIDKHLNSIPLKLWDVKHDEFKKRFLRVGINVISISDTVCTLKHAAKMWVLERIDTVDMKRKFVSGNAVVNFELSDVEKSREYYNWKQCYDSFEVTIIDSDFIFKGYKYTCPIHWKDEQIARDMFGWALDSVMEGDDELFEALNLDANGVPIVQEILL